MVIREVQIVVEGVGMGGLCMIIEGYVIFICHC